MLSDPILLSHFQSDDRVYHENETTGFVAYSVRPGLDDTYTITDFGVYNLYKRNDNNHIKNTERLVQQIEGMCAISLTCFFFFTCQVTECENKSHIQFDMMHQPFQSTHTRTVFIMRWPKKKIKERKKKNTREDLSGICWYFKEVKTFLEKDDKDVKINNVELQ